MTEEFLLNPSTEPNPPISSTPDQSRPSREKLKHILIGSPKGVRSAIHALQVRGYAEVGAWSSPQPTNNPNEVMSILVRYILQD